MKKMYSVIALVAAVGLSASASDRGNLSSAKIMKAEKNVQLNEVKQSTGVDNGMRKEMAYGSVDDLVGVYDFYYANVFDGAEGSSVVITKGEGANDLVIYGLYQGGVSNMAQGVKATYNPETRIISVPSNQFMYLNTYYNENVNFYAFDYKDYKELSSMDLTVCPQGITVKKQDGSTENQYEKGCIATLGSMGSFFTIPSELAKGENAGGFAGAANLVMAPRNLYADDEKQNAFVFDENEWDAKGTCDFTDGFLFCMFTGQVPDPWKVDLMKKKGVNEFLLVNPYANAPYDFSDGFIRNQGYIYINAQNPDCVLVRPVVYCGVNHDEYYGPLFVSNDEGVLYYLNDYSYSDVIDEMKYFQKDCSKMSDDGTDVVIDIQNGGYADAVDVEAYKMFKTQNEESIPINFTVAFKSTQLGVNDILDNSDNAPKHFFNLQGVEVANPEAGQIVIVKQGNKSYKTIAK